MKSTRLHSVAECNLVLFNLMQRNQMHCIVLYFHSISSKNPFKAEARLNGVLHLKTSITIKTIVDPKSNTLIKKLKLLKNQYRVIIIKASSDVGK